MSFLPLQIVLIVALFVQGVAAPAVPPGESAFATMVDEAALRRYVRELVAFGPRMGGTPSNDRSAAYLEKYFRALQLEVEVVEDPPALAHWEDSWRVEVEGARLESAWPMGFSPSVEKPVTAPVLEVIDLARAVPDERWRGKIVYTPGNVGRSYAAILKSGFIPAAIVTSAPNVATRYIDWSRLASLAPRADNPVPAFTVSYLDGRTLAAAAAAGRSATIALAATVREGRAKTVIATLPGGNRRTYFLVCAHGDSDSGGPGADDNASGVATVMEIARVYSALVRSGKLPVPRHSIRFAIWGAEYQSARAFIEREGEGLRNAQAVLNFDQTGTGAERDAIYFEGNDVPWNAPLLRTFEQVAGEYANQPGFWSEYTTNPSQGGTDSYAFLPRQYRGRGYTALQIPATTIFTAAWDGLNELQQTPGWESRGTPDAKQLKIDYSRFYHSSGDTPENTTEREPHNMVRAVKATGLVLIRMNRS